MAFSRFMCRFGWLFALAGGVLGWFVAPTSTASPTAYAGLAAVLLVLGLVLRRRRTQHVSRR